MITINYTRSLELYPIETEKIINKLKSGKSQFKNVDPNQVNFTIEYSIGDPCIKGSNDICVYCLMGKISRWHWRTNINNRQFVPDEVLNNYLQS